MPLSSAYQEWITHDFLKFKPTSPKEQEDWIESLKGLQSCIQELLSNVEEAQLKEQLFNNFKEFFLKKKSENIVDKITRNLEYLEEPILIGIETISDEKEFFELIDFQINNEILRLTKAQASIPQISKRELISFLQTIFEESLAVERTNQIKSLADFKRKLIESISILEMSFLNELIQNQIEQLSEYGEFLTEYQLEQVINLMSDRVSIKLLDVQKNKLLTQPEKSSSVYPYSWLKNCHYQLIQSGNREELLAFDLIMSELTQTVIPSSEIINSASVYFIDEEEVDDIEELNRYEEEDISHQGGESDMQPPVVDEEHEEEEIPSVTYTYAAAARSTLGHREHSETRVTLEGIAEVLSTQEDEESDIDENSDHESIGNGTSNNFNMGIENFLTISELFIPGATIFSTNSMFIRQTLEVIYRQFQENQDDLKEMVSSIIFQQAALRGDKIWAELVMMPPSDRRYWNRWIIKGYQDDAQIVLDLLMSKNLNHLLTMTLKARPFYLSTKFTMGSTRNLNLLHRAIISHFNLDLIESLIKLGVSSFDRDSDERTPLLMLLELASPQMLANPQYTFVLEQMMRQGCVDFLQSDKDFFLKSIIEHNISKLIKAIGPSYNWKEPLNCGLTPLIFALELRKPEVALELIKLNAFTHAELPFLLNNMMLLNYNELLLKLIEEVDINELRNIRINGLNLLHLGICNCDTNLIRACLEKGFSPFEKSQNEASEDAYDLIDKIDDLQLKERLHQIIVTHSSLVVFSPEFAFQQTLSFLGKKRKLNFKV